MTTNPYLTFDGNCGQAFDFYKSVFGGDFTFKGRMGDMPASEDYPPVPEDQADRVMHVSLPISKECILMGSDTVDGMSPPLTVGNNFSISVSPDSKEEANRIFGSLASGGEVVMSMGDVFWGDYFGMCVDQFGIQWMVGYNENKSH